MSEELKAKLKELLDWKQKHNDLILDYVQVAKYLGIDNRSAEDIVEALHRKHYLMPSFYIHCDECGEVVKVKGGNVHQNIQCTNPECSKTLLPDKLINGKTEYIYEINAEKFFKRKKKVTSILPYMVKEDTVYMSTERKINVFLSYSHVDEEYKISLDNHLAVQKRNNRIATWNDRKLIAGSYIHEEIDEELVRADVIILLLSADFFASDYCYGIEMKKALEIHEQGKNVIIPVIVRPCDWLDSPLKKFVGLPEDGKPISKWENQDEAYMSVVAGIKKAIEDIL